MFKTILSLFNGELFKKSAIIIIIVVILAIIGAVAHKIIPGAEPDNPLEQGCEMIIKAVSGIDLDTTQE